MHLLIMTTPLSRHTGITVLLLRMIVDLIFHVHMSLNFKFVAIHLLQMAVQTVFMDVCVMIN